MMDSTESREPAAADRPLFVVEDESLVAMGLRSMLQSLGYEAIHIFPTAEGALEQLAALEPAMIFMDIKLGDGLDGLAAAREVMERRPCPVIITSAYTEENYLREAMQSHVFGYLVKPIITAQLATTMTLARDRFAEFQRLHAENNDLRQALETRKLVERAKGVLMSHKNLSESEAYKLMRTQSQQRSLPMRDIAQSIIDAAAFL